MNTNAIHLIELQAMQGRALASLLETASTAEDFCVEDVGVLAYILQQHFMAILEALEEAPSATA